MSTPIPTTPDAQSAHTPTPWHLADAGIFGEQITEHGNFYVVALPFPIEPVTRQDTANLRLIVTAVNERASLLAERDALRAALDSSNKEAERTGRPTFRAALAQGGAK